jgi:putative ABC transport system ATP-binding protein
MKESIRAENVRKVYESDGNAVEALRGVSFEIQPGEFTALAGPSGSGKSTLLNLLGGLDQLTSGEIWIGESAVSRLSAPELCKLRLRKIGFIFQAYNLIPVLTVAENVEYVLMLQGVSSAERRRRSVEILADVGLQGYEDRWPARLSGGQQQRVAVARAIVSEPALVLADEPTANLDSKTAGALLELMADLNLLPLRRA